MAAAKIELRKIRDFGTVISDDFAFIKQEFKPLFRSVLLYAGVFILATGIFQGLTYGQHNIWNEILNSRHTPEDRANPFDRILTANYFIALFCSFLAQASIVTAVACYMKAYKDNGNESPASQEVWALFSHYIFPVAGISFVLGLLTLLGFALCIIPGIYLFIVLAPIPFVIIIEDDRSFNVFGRCFDLIKENFWPSLGLYFVLAIIYSVCASIIGAILGAIAGLAGYFTTKDISTSIGLVYGIFSVIPYLFIIILYTGIGLNYFSLEEKLDGTGMMEKINAMGSNETNDTDEAHY